MWKIVRDFFKSHRRVDIEPTLVHLARQREELHGANERLGARIDRLGGQRENFRRMVEGMRGQRKQMENEE